MLFNILLSYLTIGGIFAAYQVWSGSFDLKAEMIEKLVSRQDFLNEAVGEALGNLALVIFFFGWLPILLSKPFRDTSDTKKALELYKEGNKQKAIKILEQKHNDNLKG